MAKTREHTLDAVRTDGWFERIGEGIGSFQALCDIVGEAFFAFSMITGARITALTVDRRNPDNTLVDFVVGTDDEGAEPQRLTLVDFRHRLVGALLTDDPTSAPPTRDGDLEGPQRHIGVSYRLPPQLYWHRPKKLRRDVARRRLDARCDRAPRNALEPAARREEPGAQEPRVYEVRSRRVTARL